MTVDCERFMNAATTDPAPGPVAVSLVVVVELDDAASASLPFTGRHVYQWLLREVQEFDPVLSKELHSPGRHKLTVSAVQPLPDDWREALSLLQREAIRCVVPRDRLW
jgi:hypothetical protein